MNNLSKINNRNYLSNKDSNDTFGVFQFDADCLDDMPPDYEASVGGPPTNPISGASDITFNESSVVLDPVGRAIGLEQLHPNAEIEPQTGEESHMFASSKYRKLISLTLAGSQSQHTCPV